MRGEPIRYDNIGDTNRSRSRSCCSRKQDDGDIETHCDINDDDDEW